MDALALLARTEERVRRPCVQRGGHIKNTRTIVLRLAAVAFVFGEYAKRKDGDVGKAREIVYDSR